MNQYVYILSNPSLPSLHKIGYTANSIEERMEQLYSTGVPTKFELEFCIEVVNGLGTEQHFHKLFSQFHHGKEFFKLPLAKLIKILKEELIKGEIEFINYYGRANKLYLLDDEKERMQREIERIKKIKSAEEKIKIERELEKQIKKQKEHEKKEALKKVIRKNTTELIKIILLHSTYLNGNLLTRIRNTNHFEDGKEIGKKINESERMLVIHLYEALKELEKSGVAHFRLNDIYQNSTERIELVLDISHKFTYTDKKNIKRNSIRYNGLSQFTKGIIYSITNLLE